MEIQYLMARMDKKTLAEIPIGFSCKMIAVKDNSSNFLQYVVKLGLGINNQIKVVSRQPYDQMTVLEVNGKNKNVSYKFTENIYVL
jgi:DtxR family transcriptional regulator, Mn-dependent transcriptional regulator